jgi:DNA (cytosine-5)-methyltransferase 1
MSAYYNEFDSFAAEWLRELIKDGLIADGVVDERSIEDVDPKDIKEFTQCHFFAGIGGWSYAARLANWPDDRPMWTGSPPCQPFSSAGNRKGKDDLRHLWPVFFNLIRECQPSVVFGEQVASAIRMGWFDDLQADMENEGYATGMVVLPANFVGAPHKRERLFYVAERMADTSSNGWEKGPCQASRCMGDTEREGLERYTWTDDGKRGGSQEVRSSTEAGFWSDTGIVQCRDGKLRPAPTEPALFPLANGIPNRVGILRGAGNAIVPQVGAEVIKAYMEEAV